TPLISSPIGCSIRHSCLFGRYRGTVIKISGPGCRCYAWLAHVRRRTLLRVSSGRLRMLRLSRYRRNMPVTRRSLFLLGRTRADSTIAAVITDAALVVVRHMGVVNIVNVGHVHVAHGTVVEKVSVIPAPTLEARTEVAEAVIDPAVETYVWAPVAVIENKSVAAPTPIGWRPQETDFRTHHPRARHPVVIGDVVVVGPVTGCPEITVAWTERLLIDRQRRRPDPDGDANLRERRCRYRQHDEPEQ